MTLRELRYLVALADHGHFGRAAEACHVSQPTLSIQIRKLEDYLGVVLFERTNKAVHITPAGERIVERARRILAESEAIEAFARQRAAPLSGPLHLGVIPTLSPYLLPWLVPALGEAFPSLRLVLHEDLTAPLLSALKEHRIDVALLALPVDEPEVASVALFDEPFFLACPKGHALTRNDVVEVEELQRDRLLLLTDGHCLRDQALAVCGLSVAGAARAEADVRATSLETVRQMVAAGMGCTLLPAMAIGEADRDLLGIRPIAGRHVRRIGLVWRRTYPQIADLELLAQTVRDNLPASVSEVAAGDI